VAGRLPAIMLTAVMRFPDPVLAMDGRYPDDFNLSLPNPNAHSTAVLERVVVDLHDRQRPAPTLAGAGVEFVDLRHLPGLTDLLHNLVHEAGIGSMRLQPSRVAALHHAFLLRSVQLHSPSAWQSGWLLFLHAEPSGMFSRFVGPGGQFLEEDTVGSSFIPFVHGDQNVHGSPIQELFWGAAPALLSRTWSPLRLLNVWMPAQRVVAQPLVLMDDSTLNESASRLEYHIYANDGLGERLNDCWTYLFDARTQRWLTHGLPWDMGRAAVFHTLYTPHSSFALPGETRRTAPLWMRLREARRCVQQLMATGADSLGLVHDACDCMPAKGDLMADAEAEHDDDIVGVADEAAHAASELVRNSAEQMRRTLELARSEWCATLPLGELYGRIDASARHNARISLELRVVALHVSLGGLVTALASTLLCAALLCRRRPLWRWGVGVRSHRHHRNRHKHHTS
jgi:hypothetical protein